MTPLCPPTSGEASAKRGRTGPLGRVTPGCGRSAGLPAVCGRAGSRRLLGTDRARRPSGQSARPLVLANGASLHTLGLRRLWLIVLVLRLTALNFLVRADITNQAAAGDAKWTDTRGQARGSLHGNQQAVWEGRGLWPGQVRTRPWGGLLFLQDRARDPCVP